MNHSNDRRKVVEKIERIYDGKYGEYKYYAGQSFIFRDGDVANKTLLIRSFENLDNRPSGKHLKIKAKQVYERDTVKDLKRVVEGLTRERDWYDCEFGDIPGLNMPKEKYSICEDPLGTENKTVLISTEWIENIQGDIFRIEADKLYEYIIEYPDFKETLIQLITKFIELSKEDIYPDYTGIDNVAIYLEGNTPKIALIDRHIIAYRKYCDDNTQAKMDIALDRLKKFLENPTNIENIRSLTSGELS